MRIGQQLILGLALHGLACTESKPERQPEQAPATAPTTKRAELRPPEVRFTGCTEASVRTRVCELPTAGAELRVWVRGTTAPLVTLTSGAKAVPMRPHAGGFLGVVEARPVDGGLTIALDGAAPWAITFDDLGEAVRVSALAEPLGGDHDDPLAVYAEVRRDVDAALGELEGYERRTAQRLLLKLQLALGDKDALLTTGTAVFEEAIRLDHVGAAVQVVDMVGDVYLERSDEATLQWLVDVASLHVADALDDERRAELHYYRGLLAHGRGDFRAALAEFELAHLDSVRLELPNLEALSASFRLAILGILGRRSEQSALVQTLVEASAGSVPGAACMRARAQSNAAWGVLMATAPGTASPQAARLLEAAMAGFGEGGGCDVREHPGEQGARDDAAITHAVEALWRDDPDEAARRIATIDPEAVAPAQRPWVRYLSAAVAAARDDPKTARAQLELATAAADEGNGLDPLLAWRMAVLRGDVERKAGNLEAAALALTEAESEVDAALRQVGLSQGREGLAAGLGRSAALAVETRLALDDTAGAVTVARRARSRDFRPIGRTGRVAALAPDDRQRWQTLLGTYRKLSESMGQELATAWKLPADERARVAERHEQQRAQMRATLDEAYALVRSAEETPDFRSPDPGEVWLLYTPVTTGWVGFAITDVTTAVASFTAAQVEAATHGDGQLLEPFADSLRASERVVALPTHALMSVAFGDLAFGEGKLRDEVVVVYGVDLPERTDSATARRRALVVGDPATRGGLGRLPGAAAEARSVADRLRRHGWQVTLRTGEDAAHEAVSADLAKVDLFHYAGHGVAGEGAWDFTLPLVGEATFGVGDVLALRRAPRFVVLTGCETGRVDATLGGGGIHVAAAFLLAGSQFVVAASEPVDDEIAATFGAALYERSGAAITVDDLVRAEQAVRAKGGKGTLFRAWVP